MKNIGDGQWHYNGCDIFLAEHPKLQGKYEIFKGDDFVVRASTLPEAKQKIIDRYGKMSGGKRDGAGRPEAPYTTQTIAFRVRDEWVDDIKHTVKEKVSELSKLDKKK